MDIQELLNQATKQWRIDRANSQMTLGELIAALSVMPEHKQVQGLCKPHSYRGYYTDLAFEEAQATSTAGLMLEMVKECLDQTFIGWKGGDFVMTKITPLWIAERGASGLKIVGLDPNGDFLTREDD